MNQLVGVLGHGSVVVAFVAALVAALGYFQATRLGTPGAPERSWLLLGRGAFIVHGVAVLGVIVSLFDIIYHHRYEYYYAWSHSSNHLPVRYMISCFWEGQEGSFLLWIFWHAVLGAILITRAGRRWEAPVLAVVAGVQVFLVSMILGIILTPTLRLGSSPFLLLRDFMGDIPVYKLNPNFVPEDGTGLNPLLQNYWMVIHPPTLFLGFALTLIPFAFAIAGLWQRLYTEWLQPALAWSLAGAGILGIGIMMGAYWAYETLNFGGYWNWDPVENAVYIPWLVLVAALHLITVYRRSKTGLRATFVLNISTFLLILYATFLTRSGVLGSASVHSFTDLGLSGQLIVYLAAFVIMAIVLLANRWKAIPGDAKELTTWNAETWVFVGVAVLGLGAFQVLATTSIPVYRTFVELLGFHSSAAYPADQIGHYTKFQLWVGVGIAALTGTAQLLWWQKVEKGKLLDLLAVPLMLALLFAALFILLGKMKNPAYIVLLTTGLFAVIANGAMLLHLVRRGTRVSGGGIAHIGIALMLLGVLYSSGYSHIISKNTSGLTYSKELPEDINRDNVLLWRNQEVPMSHYGLTYKGQYLEVKGLSDYVNKDELFVLPDDEYRAILRADLKKDGKVLAKLGDTLDIYPENTYYEVAFQDKQSARKFTLYPRAQVNPEMGLLASPDIKVFWDHDIYAHVSTVPKPDEEKEWSPIQEYHVKAGDTLILNDYITVLRAIEPATDVTGLGLVKGDIALQADLLIEGETRKYHAHPVFAIKGNQVGRVADEIPDLGLRITFLAIDPQKGEFTIGVNTSQKDYIILKAMEKPYINLLWLGTGLMGLGLAVAAVRRSREGREKVAEPVGTAGVVGARPVRRVVA